MSITGKKREEINKEWMFEKITDYVIYQYYIPDFHVGRALNSPFREDKNPSFYVFLKDNKLLFKDFGDSKHKGDVISFVQQRFFLDYHGALRKIAEDFGLLEESGKKYERIIATSLLYIKKEKNTFIQVKGMKCKEEHINYLKSYFLTIDDLNFCKDTKCMAIKEWSCNRLKMPLKENEVAFAYYYKDEELEGVKIYRPFAPKKDKWRTSIPNNVIMGLSCLNKCEKIIISKGLKDSALMYRYTGIPCLTVQSESFSCFTDENILKINQLAENVYLNFDNDKAGKENSLIITEKTGWKHINVPDEYLEEGITDYADLVKTYGIEKLINHFKTKKII